MVITSYMTVTSEYAATNSDSVRRKSALFGVRWWRIILGAPARNIENERNDGPHFHRRSASYQEPESERYRSVLQYAREVSMVFHWHSHVNVSTLCLENDAHPLPQTKQHGRLILHVQIYKRQATRRLAGIQKYDHETHQGWTSEFGH